MHVIGAALSSCNTYLRTWAARRSRQSALELHADLLQREMRRVELRDQRLGRRAVRGGHDGVDLVRLLWRAVRIT